MCDVPAHSFIKCKKITLAIMVVSIVFKKANGLEEWFFQELIPLQEKMTNFSELFRIIRIHSDFRIWIQKSKFLEIFRLSNKVEKCLCIQFVCLSVCHALILVNIYQMAWNLNMLLMSNIAWTVLKIVYMGLMVHLQRHTKVFWYIMADRGGGFKREA